MLSNKVVDKSGNTLQSFKEWVAGGGLERIPTEIKSGKEAPTVLMPGSPLLKSTQPNGPKAHQVDVITGDDVERDLVGSTKKLARANTDRTKYNVYKAQNDLDDYLKSDEYKQKRAERGQRDTAQTYAAVGEYNYTTAPVTMDEKEKELRAALKRAEDEEAAAVERKAIADDLEAITGLSEDERKQLELFTAQSNYGTMSQSRADMTAADLFDKYGKDRVVEMSNTLRRQQNEERAQDVDAKAREFANEHGVLASAATVPVAAVSGITGTFGQLRELGRGDDRYRTIDPNARGTMGDVFTGAVRGQVGENIEESLGGGTLGKAGSIAYQGVMSAADSVARAFIGGGALGGAALAATGSFSQTMADASRNGATPAEAAILATATAGIEALSEKIPLENLIKTAKGKNFASVAKNALRQMGIEATTEEISLFSSIMAEAAILQEKSSYRQDIVNGVAQGLTPDEAIAQANRNVMNEALNTLLVSAVSGGISSVGGSIADARGMFADEQARNNPAANKPKQGDVVKSKEALLQKYAQPEAQAQQTAFNVEQDKATMPETIREVIAQNEKENLWSDTVIPYRTDAIKNDPAAMKWLADRGLSEGDMQKNLDNLSAGRYQLTKPAEATTQAETVQPEIQQSEAEPAAQEPVQPQQNVSDVIAETFKTAREKNAPAPEADVQTSAQQNANESEPEASTPAMDTQTAPDTASPTQESQSADGGQQTQAPQGKPETQRDRINAVREQEIPVTDKDGRKVSEFVGNAYQSSLTPDSFTPTIKRLVDEGQVSYDVQTNEESLRKGAQMIAEAGTERDAVNKIRDFANTGKFTPEHIAMGTLLYQDLTAQIDEQAKNGKVDPNLQRDAEDVFVSMKQMATNSGRSLQLFNLFRKMTPESQVRVMQKEVQRNIERMQKAGTVKKDYKAEIDPQLTSMYRDAASEYQKAKTEEAKQAAEQKMQDIQNVIYAEEAAKLPTTFKAKWDAWRYMAMLGNAKTQIRNVAGNALMMPYTEVKRTVGSILEKGVAQDKRTKSAFVDKELLAWAKQDTINVKSVLDGSAKLGDSGGKNPFADDIKTFGDSWAGERLNELQGVINKAVSNGDMFFKNAEYARSLAGFLKARGYTAAAVQTEGAVPVEVMNEARNYAINEAMKATFNDSNKLSDALSSLRYNGDNPVMKAINMMGEGIMPFRKTPANVLMRFKDYSPVGLTHGLWNMAKNVRNGNVTAATAIDQISAGLTGTGVMMLGYALAGGINGIKLTGSGADEDEKRQGHQNYALEFSVNGEEYSFTIDWASPFNLPLFLGANLRDAWESDDTASFYTAVMNAGKGAVEPLLQLSCLSSLNDLVEGVRYSEEGEGLYTIASKMATSYFTQGVPSLARQITQAANETKQTTFVTAEDPVMQDIQKTVAGVGVGNPYKTDKVNAWGEKETTGTAVERIVNAFLNPGTLKKIDNSAAEQEISRLNDAGENVTPDTFAKTITYTNKSGEKHDNVRLTEEQYQTLAQTQGQTARKLLDELVKSKNYQALDDEQKAKAINEAYAYARKTGEIAAIGKDHTGYNESWMMDVQKKGANEILRRVVTSQLGGAMSDIDNAWDKGYNEEAFIREMESAFDSYSKLGADMKKQVYEESSGTAKKYIEARTSGVSHDDFLRAAKAVAKTTGTGAVSKETGKPGVRDIDRRQAIANTTGLTEKEVDAIMKVYMADYDPTDETPETTELKYQYAREELGLSPAEYASTYRAYLDNGRKAQKISAMMELGYDRKTATALYKLYFGSMKKDLIEMYG